MIKPAGIAVVAASCFALAFALVGSPAAQGQQEEPKNLKVLPKGTSHREVVNIMRGMSSALGVRCDECHAQNKAGNDMDFASDEKPAKETARKMMKLVGSINEQIAAMGDKDAPQVRCVTCHRGVKRPETLAALMTGAIEKNGVSGAIDRYRKLRERYYGTGSYDFSPASLNEVASGLAEGKKDYAGATQILQLNLEFSPKDAETYVTLARVQQASGDNAAATASLEKALQIDPNNRWAKQMLQRLKGGQ